ncbi:MAG: hypothetical protein IJM37_00990 [Lachnospiraceae bacterium]|nr:hypothetical protein [Lachnospiraceae bacterium]
MKDKLVEVSEYTGEGYLPVITYQGWRVAILNYIDELEAENIERLQYHDETDEVFVLLKGSFILYVAGNDPEKPGEIEAINLEPYKMYNVKRGTWHTHTLSRDAMCLIIENSDTEDDVNSPRVFVTERQKKQLVELFENIVDDKALYYGRKKLERVV